jgi:hypothetical protein
MVERAADPGPLRAYELVMAFAARRGEAALRLAMHAALPQVLRAELLHLIRLNFLPEGAHDLAVEADVLFAPFCEDIGNGYYCFAGNARLQLLQGLDPAYREESIARSVQVARFMLDYLEHERRNVRAVGDRLHSDWIDVERWSALAFAEPALAAGQLAAALAHATASDDVAARVRVGGLASALAAPLVRFGELLTYAEGVEALQAGDHDQAIRLFGAIPDRELEVAGIRLKSPRRVLAESIEREAPAFSPAASHETAEPPAAAEEAPVEPAVPNPPERGGIFIVHRRDDAASQAMRLRESLRARFGDRVFADVADIEAGADLLATIRSAIRESAAVVALIGPRWLDSRQSDRRRRIDSGGDFVRIQLAEALQSGIQVVPVLVGGAALPRADELPGDLARLADLHALELHDADWEADCTRLADVLERFGPEVERIPSGAQVEERKGLRPLRVYLSATIADLAREREAVVASLRRLGHQVVGAEAYVAADQRPLAQAYGDIAACDVLVCIVAWAYGFIPASSAGNPEQRSIVELEYRHALALGKPVLAFMRREDVAWNPKVMDVMTGEGEKGGRISAFRRELAETTRAQLFHSADELGALVLEAVGVLDERRRDSDEPRVASQALIESERLLAEIARPETDDARRAGIGDRLDRIGDPRPGVGIRSDGTPEFVWREIPPGSVQLEGVEGTFEIERFFITVHPVTWRQYRAFVDDPQGYRDERWWQDLRHEKEPGAQSVPTGNCPAVNVSWYDAIAYCRWASVRLGHELRLPNEWEWQQAATGGDPTRTYPWGREWEAGRANTFESGLPRAIAVGMHPAGATPQGVLDMAGNVWEWCLNPYDSPNDTAPRGSSRRVVRGGSWGRLRDGARCAARGLARRGARLNDLGFRVLCVSPILKR